TRKEERDVLTELLSAVDVTFYEEKLNSETANLALDADIVSVFINSEISKEIIDLLPNLKFVSTRSTGFDHIDINELKNKNIIVSNVPSYGSHTVAEFAFALILDLSRKVSNANRQVREESNFDTSGFKGFDLFGKTLGVIGTGKIGKNIVKIAKGFGMKVIAFDAYPDDHFATENNFQYFPLNEVLANSDIVTLHTPYNKDTHHLINEENIKLFKNGSYLINTARGEILDTEALLFGLREGIIAGAGLDVLEDERKLKEEAEFIANGRANMNDFKILLEDHMLIDMPNVIVTPHIAFDSSEAEIEILKTTVENILAFNSGVPQNIVK
ncbi:MAG: NAD(P)-dependent oxidoreductase, partial [Candidatus Paceibacterota bacterium]